ncbi:hypothetical protein K0M31_001927 [Melipona bicolor]|uniref:Uncharacterized protein n=1 Tax=Melipona bicolor TaxID=60889 RepID=A0AA40KYL6_9HYME|nr:hypothetical protein K0M31_001927 [Melipona bicolor]
MTNKEVKQRSREKTNPANQERCSQPTQIVEMASQNSRGTQQQEIYCSQLIRREYMKPDHRSTYQDTEKNKEGTKKRISA